MGPVSEYGHPCRKLTFDRSKQRSTIYDRVERLDLKVQMKASESSTVAVLTEKPSVARDIARVLGADKRGERNSFSRDFGGDGPAEEAVLIEDANFRHIAWIVAYRHVFS